jgi:hypothetical protein
MRCPHLPLRRPTAEQPVPVTQGDHARRAVLRRNASLALLAFVLVGLAGACGGKGRRATVSTPNTPKLVSRTFVSIGDAYVRKSQPRVNFGKTSELRIDGLPPARAYLRFQPFGIAGKIKHATLRIYTLTASRDGFEVRGSSGGWAEWHITFANAPRVGNVINVSGLLARDAWQSIDVSRLIRSRTASVAVALTGIGPTELAIASRERRKLAPRLIVESTR